MSAGFAFGAGLVIIAGCAWGSMGVVGQYLMQNAGFTPTDLVTARMIGAGLCLLAANALGNAARIRLTLTTPAYLRTALIYGLGLLIIQWTFFLAIHLANAGTAAIMVMTAPLFVLIYYVLRGKPIVLNEALSVLMAIVGVILIVTKGQLDTLNMSIAGVAWGMTSAAAGAFCTLYPRELMSKVGMTTVIAIGMLFGGLLLSMLYPPWQMSAQWNPYSIAGYAYIVLVGTIASFWCYFKSMDYITPTATMILTAFEPLSAVLLSVWWLNVEMTTAETIGAIMVMSTVFLLALNRR